MSGTAIRLGRMAIILMLGTPMVIGGLSLFRAVAGRQLCWLSTRRQTSAALGQASTSFSRSRYRMRTPPGLGFPRVEVDLPLIQ